MGKLMRVITFFSIFFSSLSWSLSPLDMAPDFELVNQKGKKIKLSNFKGKTIVLEWVNFDCPFVKKHYGSKNMQTTQRLYKNNDSVIWLSIVSSAKGKQGHLKDSKMAQEKMKANASQADHLLLDPSGKVGRLYEAKTTPHIFIIGPQFKIQYMGAIDSIASAYPSDIPQAKNYVTSSVSKILLKEKPNPQKTKAYGCSVKY